MERALMHIAPLAGVLFVVLVVASFVVEGSSPTSGDPSSEVVAFYEGNTARVETASALAAIGGVALIVFGVRVSASMRERGTSALSLVALAGASVAAAGIGVDSALRYALASSAGETSPEATQAIFEVWSAFFWPMHVGMAAFALAVSLASFDNGLLPLWLAGLGVVAAMLVMVPVAATLVVGIVAVAVWTLAASGFVHLDRLRGGIG